MNSQAVTVSYQKTFISGPKRGTRLNLCQDFPNVYLAESWVRQLNRLCEVHDDNPLTYIFENFEIGHEKQ